MSKLDLSKKHKTTRVLQDTKLEQEQSLDLCREIEVSQINMAVDSQDPIIIKNIESERSKTTQKSNRSFELAENEDISPLLRPARLRRMS